MLSVCAQARAVAEVMVRLLSVCVSVPLCVGVSVHVLVCVCVPAVGSSRLCSGLVCCQACALAMRVQFLRYSLFAVYLEKHKSASA